MTFEGLDSVLQYTPVMEKEPLLLENRQVWRRWLEENSGTAVEVWLVHFKQKSGRAGLTLAEGVEEALCFGWIDGRLESRDRQSYILRYSPRQPGSLWSRINRRRAEKLISAGRMTTAGLARIEEARRNGNWDAAYTSLTPAPLPPDLEAALREQPAAWHNFSALANSYRNMYIGWVTGAKTPATRARRIAEVVRRAAADIKPG